MNPGLRKGFRTPAKPTNGQLTAENQKLAEENSQMTNISTQVQFMGNMLSQLMNVTREMKPEVDALSTLEAAAIAPAGTEAANGDHVMIDYLGVVLKDDGSPELDDTGLPAYQQSMYGLKFTIRNLGAGSLIPGFETAIVGKTVGTTFEIEPTFPAEYGVKELAGRKAKFMIHVHRIYRPLSVSPVESAFGAWIQAKTAAQKTQDESKTTTDESSQESKTE